jgi:hypothetical protein
LPRSQKTKKDTAQRALARIGLNVSDLWNDNGETMLSISEMKDVLDKCDTIEKEVLNEMAARYRPEVFNSENAIEQPKLDEYREKNGFPNVEDEKKSHHRKQKRYFR